LLRLLILSERQRSRATELLSECNAYADGSDSPIPGDPSMQPVTRAPTSARPSTRHHPTSERPSTRHHDSAEEGATPRSREDRAQAPKALNQQGTSSAPPYPRGDLIDLVASKKASTNQTRNFHSKAVHDEAFHQ
jgi:hypothetical protein